MTEAHEQSCFNLVRATVSIDRVVNRLSEAKPFSSGMQQVSSKEKQFI